MDLPADIAAQIRCQQRYPVFTQKFFDESHVDIANAHKIIFLWAITTQHITAAERLSAQIAAFSALPQ